MKKVSGSMLIILFLFFLASCSNDTNKSDQENGEFSEDEDLYGGSLVVETKLEPKSFIYNYDWDGAIPYVNRNIFSKLAAFDEESKELYGDLAESWEESEDLKEYTFHLREDVEWHDGEPFTSEDVKWTIEDILDYGEGANGYDSLSNVKKVETPDDSTVVIKLKEPSGVFVEKIADYTGFDILPEHIYEDNDVDEVDPVGTGPFVFEEFETGEHISLKANEDYFGDGPFLDEVVFTFTPSESTALNAIESGESGWMTASPAFAELDRLENDEEISADLATTDIVQWMGFNMDGSREEISDPKVREAISYAIDNDDISEKVYSGRLEPATSWYSTNVEWADNKDVTIPDTDIEHANELLDDAGYSKDDEGKRFSLTFRTFETSIFGTTDIPNIVRQQLDEIGIEVDVEQYEWAIRDEMLDEQRDWDIMSGGGDRGPDPLNFEEFLKSDTATNKMQYDNEEVDNLFKKGEEKLEDEERAPYYHDIQKIMSKDIPIYNFVEYEDPSVYNNDYKGFFWQDEKDGNSAKHMINNVQWKGGEPK